MAAFTRFAPTTLLLGFLAATAGACSEDEDTVPNSQISTLCANYALLLTDCGLLGPGRFACAVGQDATLNACYETCVSEASCDGARSAVCSNTVYGELSQCFIRCSAVFECADGSAVPAGFACDGEEDCADATDEVNCQEATTFTCDGGETIDLAQRCNGALDCGSESDTSDEADCPPQPLFACLDGSVILAHQECDGVAQCADGSDETCAEYLCTAP